MAKVEMSLAEYDALKSEMDFLKRIIAEITTPVIDDWEFGYYTERKMNCKIRSKLSEPTKEFLATQVMNNLPDELQGTLPYEVIPDLSSPEVVRLSFDNVKNPIPEDAAEDTAVEEEAPQS